MAYTAIQLVNEIGKNLRRSTGSTYTTFTQDYNAVIITQFLNIAKQIVEDEWQWPQLEKSITFSSVAGTATYDTSSLSIVTSDPNVTNERSYVKRTAGNELQAWEVTSGREMRLREVTRDYAEHMNLVNAVSVEHPTQVAIYQTGAGLTAHFPYPPAGVYNYKFKAIVPQAPFTTTTTELLVPPMPVIIMATALCFQERGEEFGPSPLNWMDLYEQVIGAAISGGSTSEDMVMRRV